LDLFGACEWLVYANEYLFWLWVGKIKSGVSVIKVMGSGVGLCFPGIHEIERRPRGARS
jgi:hypothetical protein